MPRNSRLDALYRSLVKKYGKAEADRRIREATTTAHDHLEDMIRKKAQANLPPTLPAGAPKGSRFLRHLAKGVELWTSAPS